MSLFIRVVALHVLLREIIATGTVSAELIFGEKRPQLPILYARCFFHSTLVVSVAIVPASTQRLFSEQARTGCGGLLRSLCSPYTKAVWYVGTDLCKAQLLHGAEQSARKTLPLKSTETLKRAAKSSVGSTTRVVLKWIAHWENRKQRKQTKVFYSTEATCPSWLWISLPSQGVQAPPSCRQVNSR